MTPKQMVESLDGQLTDCYAEIEVKNARIAELEAALVTARENALQEAANACCHPTNVHDGGESAICRNRVLALKANPMTNANGKGE